MLCNLKLADDLSSRSVNFLDTTVKDGNRSGGYTILTEEAVPALADYLVQRGVKAVVVRPDRYPLGVQIKKGKDLKKIFWKNHTTGTLYPIR